MRFTAKLAILLSFAAIVPFAASAQTPSTQEPSAPVATTPATTPDAPAGPRIESASVAFQPVSATDSIAAEPQRRRSQGMGQAQAMMIVGGAAVVVGIIIGDDVGTLIAVSGAIVGLYGLYQYLK